MAFIPFLRIILDIFQVFFRSDFKNKEFSLITIFNTFMFFLGIIIGGYFFSIRGIIASRYIALISSIFFSLFFLKEYFKLFNSTTFPKKNERKLFLRFSIIAVITNSISSILYLIDTFLVGNILKANEIVATYKTATLIPFALNFIPLSIMVFAYPYFAQIFGNKSKIKNYYIKLQKTLLLVNGLISIFLIIFAPFIIKVVFGENYLDSAPIFRVLSFGYFIAGTFRIPAGNVLASIRMIKINLINSIISGSLNVILDIFLIKNYGAIGAAYATVSIFIISSLISNGFLYFYLKKET
jgi:O-antigen/teichoic acid export membrane protein